MHGSASFCLSTPPTELIASRCCPGSVHLRSHKILHLAFIMNNKNFNLSEKTEQRFGTYFSIYRIAGVAILPPTHPRIYMIYALCVSICAYTTLLAMLLDILQHTDDLQYCMSGIQAVTAIISSLWIRQFIRYCRSSTSKSLTVSTSSRTSY
jgi:hypothetical protein